MIARVTRVTESVAAGVVGVALPTSVVLRPLSFTAAAGAVEGAMLTAAAVYWIVGRAARRHEFAPAG